MVVTASWKDDRGGLRREYITPRSKIVTAVLMRTDASYGQAWLEFWADQKGHPLEYWTDTDR